MKKVISLLMVVFASMAAGIGIGRLEVSKKLRKEIEVKQKFSEKHFNMFLLMNQWVKIEQEGKSIHDYLKCKGYKSVAIYGMSNMAERLYDELRESDVCVKYGIDKNVVSIYFDVDIYTMDDEWEPVDAIIVTPIYYFEEIKAELVQKVKCPIISLEDLLYSL